MRGLSMAISLLFVSVAAAQSPDGAVVYLTESDSLAMAVLERYADVSALQSIDMWQPTMAEVRFAPIDTRDEPSFRPAPMRLHVDPPKPVDMNKLVWRPSSSFSITVSNGSAGNSMPWPNCPIGYLDARTLSFPLPR